MRFHVVGLPHTEVSKEYCACAYSEKCRKFGLMMKSLGHHVILYAAEGSDQSCCDELVPVISTAEQERFFGGYDWHKSTFRLKWDPAEPYWQIANMRAAAEIKAREQRGDFVCLVGGACQKPIADLVGEANSIIVEPFVGYYGIFARHRVFESYTHQACVYGTRSKDPDGPLYDAVIPNYFDPADFPFCAEKGDYLLFLARVIQRKGIAMAIETAKAAGLKLIVAGQGGTVDRDALVTEEGQRLPIGDVEYVGYADAARRAELMGHARALIQPTLFLEPFGGNVVEAQMCGTPVITTDHAVFSETVKPGLTGYRCHTLGQFVKAAKECQSLDPATIREIAIANYSMDRVKLMYQTYFEMLAGLWGEGWPALGSDAVSDLEWLRKR
jgi:glycosyltransferase involved in cell wall biosynthesis